MVGGSASRSMVSSSEQQIGFELGAVIHGSELGAMICGSEVPTTSTPPQIAWLAARRHGSWCQDVLIWRHDLWRWPTRSKHAKPFPKDLFMKKVFQKDFKKSGL